jgi:hypothetical protein
MEGILQDANQVGWHPQLSSVGPEAERGADTKGW